MKIGQIVFRKITEIIKEDKKNIGYLLYFSAIEAILTLAIPLASAFIINSLLAHSTISMFVLGFIVLTIFTLTTMLQIIKEYITEKFQQKIFVNTAIRISKMATKLQHQNGDKKRSIDKLMNYFFDVTSIQKVFPVLILDGTGLVIKIIVSLLLLLAFSPYLFDFGFLILGFYITILVLLGRHGFERAIERSDTKHKSIYYLQHIPHQEKSSDEVLEEFDSYLEDFVDARINMFRIIIRQLSLTFIMEGIIVSSFLIFGGYMVIEGTLPIGEFVAAEIVIVSITYALKGFAKQIDYLYDIIEGLYKVDKLSISLGEKNEG
jgi:ABC-type bacteriocin/lantibiotic exporter with double-glycine peptidase domain